MGKLDKYSLWIGVNFPTERLARTVSILDAVNRMQILFPELKVVSGEIELDGARLKYHWLKDSLNNVIDPLYQQHGGKKLTYIEADTKISQWKCYSCGKARSQKSNFCSPRCENKFVSYLNNFILKKSL